MRRRKKQLVFDSDDEEGEGARDGRPDVHQLVCSPLTDDALLDVSVATHRSQYSTYTGAESVIEGVNAPFTVRAVSVS